MSDYRRASPESPERKKQLADYKEWQNTRQTDRKTQLLRKKRAERKERARLSAQRKRGDGDPATSAPTGGRAGLQAPAAAAAPVQESAEELRRRALMTQAAARAAALAASAALAAAAAATAQAESAHTEAEVQSRLRQIRAAANAAPVAAAGAAGAGAALHPPPFDDAAVQRRALVSQRSVEGHAVAITSAARRRLATRRVAAERARLAERMRQEVMQELLLERERGAVRLQALLRGALARTKLARVVAEEEAALEAEIRREIRLEELAATEVQRVGRGYIGRRVAAYLLEIEEVEMRRQMEVERASKAEADGTAAAGPADTDAEKQSVWAFRYGSTPARDLSGVMPRMPGETAALNNNASALLANVRKTGRVRVLAVTWNLHGQAPPEDLTTLLPRRKFHIYVVGTEECERSIAVSVIFQRKKAWEAKLRTTLGSEYCMLMSHTLQAIHLIVYVHQALVPLIDNIESSAVAAGIGNTLGNKGGIGISFRLGSTSLLFINCHLASGQKEVQARHDGARKINAEIDLPHVDTGDIKETEAHSTDRFDRVVWMGDMNYRVARDRDAVDELLAKNKLQDLLQCDQLAAALEGGSTPAPAFKGMVEGPIKFPPTYKFDPGTLVYDTSSKKRVPSWTDRVLYKDEGVDFLAYNCCPHYKTSDHLPVYCLLNVHFEHNSDTHLKDADEVQTGKSKSQVCAIQ
eukprot:g69.t1